MSNQLIKIQTKGDVQSVSARELHEFLQVQSRFNDWIERRIQEYEFVENQDYTCLTQKIVTQTKAGKKGAAVQKEYELSLHMAKELAMLENNEAGKAARRYFIACEAALKQSSVAVAPTGSVKVEAEKSSRVIRRVSPNKLAEMLYEMCFIKDHAVRVSLAKKLYEDTLC